MYLQGAAFTVMFSALSATVSAAGASTAKDAHVEQCVKISGCISSLTQHCALEIVQTGFFNEFFQQVRISFTYCASYRFLFVMIVFLTSMITFFFSF